MADTISLDALISGLENAPKRIADEGKRIMVSETPVGPTGNLRRSIEILEQDDFHCVIGTTIEYATHVENGHGPSVAKNVPYLVFKGYKPGDKSIHWGDDSGVTYRIFSTKGAPANPFLERTAEALQKLDWVRILGM